MNKKQKKKPNVEKCHTEAERNRLYTGLMLQMSELKITEALSDDAMKRIKVIFNLYIKTGKEQEHDIDIPLLGRTMIIRLYNNVSKKSYINLKRNDEVFDHREEFDRKQVDKITEFNSIVDKLENNNKKL